MSIFFSADAVADLKLHDSSEEIACARELLTLGQQSPVKRESYFVSKESSRKLVTNILSLRMHINCNSETHLHE